MSYQQVEEVISGYLSELLLIKDSSVVEVIEKMSSEPDTQKQADSPEPKAAVNSSTTPEVKLDKSLLAKPLQERGSADNMNSDLLKHNTTVLDQVQPVPSSVEIQTKQSDSNEAAIGSKSQAEAEYNKNLVDTAKHSQNQYPSQPQALLDPEKKQLDENRPALAIENQSSKESAAYEQHKLRLEKMLKQVGELDSHSEEKLDSPLAASTLTTGHTAPNAPIANKDPIHNKSEISLNTTAENLPEQINHDGVIDNIEDETYTPLPPLSSEWLDNGRPNWAQERFEILLIEVNGLKLAVPLIALGQIQSLDEDLTPLFGQSDWFMGLQKSPAGNIKTVNTAKFVMPERYQNQHDYQFVVSINGLQWGLAVDRIHQPITVDPDSIRWRTNRSNRPWMAGMVKDHMCVLMDIPSMGEILQSEDKNHR